MDLAARQWPQGRSANHISAAARAISRAEICARSGILLRLRAAGLSTRLARRSLGRRTQSQRCVARRLRDRLGLLERAERLRAPAQEAASAPLRRDRTAAAQDRRDRSPDAAVPRLAGAPRSRLAGAARFLGPTEPAGDQSRGAPREVRRRGELPKPSAR